MSNAMDSGGSNDASENQSKQSQENALDAELEQKLANLTGAEHFLVGLTPHYWAFVPMCIAEVHRLGLVNGVDCMVVRGGSAATRFIPVSKCAITGIVVHVDRKSNGSILYLLDDGTGFMDCLQWGKSDYYKLPSLLDDPLGGNDDSFQIGDLVRVMGRLRVVSVQGVRETHQTASGREWEILNCVREVRVTTMGYVVEAENKKKNPRFCCTDAETQQWTKCIEWKENRVKEEDVITNGVDTLRLLGPKICQEALDRSDFPAADDDVGAWRVFGTSCRCEMPYKQLLLYCHCQATVEVMDPVLKFRDMLLNKLVHMEQEQQSTSEPLQFQYQAVVADPDLQNVAKTIGGSKSISVQRLFLKTFSALRKDGVLYLCDQRADIYMLVSRSRVIEPHIQKKFSKNKKSQFDYKLLQLERQSVLKDVPNSRMQHVKRCLEKSRTESQKRPASRSSTENGEPNRLHAPTTPQRISKKPKTYR